MLFGIEPHIVSLFTSLSDGATFMGGGAKLTSFIKFQDHNTHHGGVGLSERDYLWNLDDRACQQS